MTLSDEEKAALERAIGTARHWGYTQDAATLQTLLSREPQANVEEKKAAVIERAIEATAKWSVYLANDCGHLDYRAFSDAMYALGVAILESEKGAPKP